MSAPLLQNNVELHHNYPHSTFSTPFIPICGNVFNRTIQTRHTFELCGIRDAFYKYTRHLHAGPHQDRPMFPPISTPCDDRYAPVIKLSTTCKRSHSPDKHFSQGSSVTSLDLAALYKLLLMGPTKANLAHQSNAHMRIAYGEQPSQLPNKRQPAIFLTYSSESTYYHSDAPLTKQRFQSLKLSTIANEANKLFFQIS